MATKNKKAVKNVAPVKSKTKPERLVYCGPNIPGGVLQQYTVFKGGIPKYLDNLFKKCPAIKRLFVPVSDLAKVDRAVQTVGTPEHLACLEIMKGGVK